MKTLLKIGIPLLAALLLLAPGAVGLLAWPTFMHAIDSSGAIDPNVGEAIARVDERGWFASHSVRQIRVTNPDLRKMARDFLGDVENGDADPVLEMRAVMRHGPLPLASLGDGGLRPAVASSTITWTLSDGQREVELPMRTFIRTGVARSVIDFAMDAVEFRLSGEEETTLKFDGGSATTVAPNDFSNLSGSGRIGQLTVGDAAGGLVMEGANVEYDLSDPDFGFTLGTYLLRVGKITVEPGQADRDDSLTVDEIELSGANKVEADRYLATGTLTVTGAANELQRLDKLYVDYGYDVDAAAIRDLIALGHEANPQDPDFETRYHATLMGLAESGVGLDLSDLTIETPTGAVNGRFEATLPPGYTDPLDMLANARGEGRFELGRELANAIARTVPDGPEHLRMAIQTGVLKRDGDAYVSELLYSQGAMVVNGFPIPLPF